MFIRKTARLYPTKDQESFLNQNLGNQRFLWNHLVQKNRERYEQEKKFIFYHESSRLLKTLKETYEFLSIGLSQPLQQTLRDLEQSIKMCYKKKLGFPNFKKKSSGGSFRIPQGCKIVEGKLFIPKLKSGLKLKGKNIPEDFNSITIKKESSGKWFVSFVVSFVEPEKVCIKSSVGIDLNSKYLVVLNNGYALENLKYLKEKERRLKRYQRILARKVKGSNQRKKARIKLSSFHEKIRNQQKNFVEQLTTNIAKTYDHIVLEDLNVKGMQQFNGRMILMAPFGLLRNKLTWKANKFGKSLTIINRFAPTSKVCSSCGQELNLTLKDRFIQCGCGLKIHRDHNAAINIHRLGTSQINACGDTPKPIGFVNSLDWVSLKQETSKSSVSM